MPAYWVARAKMNDPAKYKKYADQVPASRQVRRQGLGARRALPDHGGPEKFQRFALIEFPTLEQGVACFTSDEYNKAAAFRRGGAGEVETVIVEGVEAGN